MQPSDVYEWVRTHLPEKCDAVFIGGGGLRAIGAIRALEETLGRPVLTANQVIFWRALRLAGVDEPIVGYGQIFSRGLPKEEKAQPRP